MKVYHERKSYATRTDEPPEKQAHGMGNGDRDWGLGTGDWGLGDWGLGNWNGESESASAGRERGQPIIPIAPPESL